MTDIGLSAAMSTYGSLVWVTRLSTGQPLPGAVVSVRRANANKEWGVARDLDLHPMGLFSPTALSFMAPAGFGSLFLMGASSMPSLLAMTRIQT